MVTPSRDPLNDKLFLQGRPVLHPEQMRRLGLPPEAAMQRLVAERKESTLTIRRLASGVWEFDSGKPGSRCVILGGNHGNEPAGVYTVMKLFHEFTQGVRSLTCGKVVLAVGNEDAVMANTREITHNLNRLFLSEPKDGSDPELVRARVLREVLFEPKTLLLDLHSTSKASRPFVVVESSQVGEAAWTPVDTVLCSKPENWHRFLDGTTQRYASLTDVTAFTLECGQHDEDSTVAVAFAAAEAFLTSYLPEVPPSVNARDRLVVEFDLIVFKDDESFSFARDFQGFDLVKKGDLIGSSASGEHRATEDCVVIFPTDPTKVKVGGDLYFLGKPLS